MFFQIPFRFSTQARNAVLIINTLLIIIYLVVFELAYAEKPKNTRQHLQYFWPLLLILFGILVYAAYKQTVQA